MKATGTNYYIVIANDIPLSSEQVVSVELIFDTLLKNQLWAFTTSAPFHLKLKPMDRVVFYAAGPNRHYFIAQARIKGFSKKISEDSRAKTVLSSLGINFMAHSIGLCEIKYINPPNSIIDLKPNLTFIKDKKNYGLHLRLPVVKVSKSDFDYIVKQ